MLRIQISNLRIQSLLNFKPMNLRTPSLLVFKSKKVENGMKMQWKI